MDTQAAAITSRKRVSTVAAVGLSSGKGSPEGYHLGNTYIPDHEAEELCLAHLFCYQVWTPKKHCLAVPVTQSLIPPGLAVHLRPWVRQQCLRQEIVTGSYHVPDLCL